MADLESLQQDATRMGWLHVKMLIVDDSRTESTILKSLLRQIGVDDITTVSSPDETILACQAHSFQVVIIDYHLGSQLSGSELLTLLRQKKLIAIDAAALLLSSDSSSEVILSSLAAGPDAFVTKPLSINSLHQNIDRAWFSSQITKPISKALNQYSISDAIQECEKQHQRFGHHSRIEKIWLDLLISEKRWEEAEQVAHQLNASQPSNYASLILAKISIHRGEVDDGIDILNEMIGQSPLFIEAYDLLVEALIIEKRQDEAMRVSHAALKLTPNATSRAMTLARLAVIHSDYSMLVYAGHCLATHLPLVGEQWLECLSSYLYEFETFFYEQPAEKRHVLLKELNTTYQRAKKRVRAAQQAKLKCLGRLAWIRLTISGPEDIEAKRQLMRALAPYFSDFDKLALTIRADAIKPLFILGEVELAYQFLLQLKKSTRLSVSTKKKYLRLINSSDLCKQGIALHQTIQTMKQYLAASPDKVKLQASHLLERYPLSNQLHFLFLMASQLLKEELSPKVNASLLSLNTAPLSSEDSQYRQELFHFFKKTNKKD